MIINLISCPRNISTALMYSFAQRRDTKVVDEPFYAHYLLTTKADHPGRKDIIRHMETAPEKINCNLLELEKNHKIVLIKNMAHHHKELDWHYFLNMRNVFLIRDPAQLIASFAQVIPSPTLQDIGLKYEAELLDFARNYAHFPPFVIDSGDILKNPKASLSMLCSKIGISFDASMLSWEKGALPEDGIWAKYWYKNVHHSTSFSNQKTSNRCLPKHCHTLYQQALPYYERLHSFSYS